MRPNTAFLKQLVTSFKGSNVVIYSVPAGMSVRTTLKYGLSNLYRHQIAWGSFTCARVQRPLFFTSRYGNDRRRYAASNTLTPAEDLLSLELNSKITTFLTTYGKTLTKDEWLKNYPQPTETS